jgi:uncharacterized membrane protein YfcA
VSVLDALLVLLAGLGAGMINTVVGSGSLITFPTLVALGWPPLIANVSNNIGLVPGALSGVYGYRRELRGQASRLRVLVPASVAGGLAGAVLLLVLPSSVFDDVVVVLVAIALVLVLAQPVIGRRVTARRTAREADHAAVSASTSAPTVPPWTVIVIGLLGIYGGYFGAAQGILLLALLGIAIDDHLQRVNAVKNVLAMSVNIVAAFVFVVSTEIDWAVVGTIAVGSTVGAQIGARYGRRLDPRALRAVIVVVGTVALVRLLA